MARQFSNKLSIRSLGLHYFALCYYFSGGTQALSLPGTSSKTSFSTPENLDGSFVSPEDDCQPSCPSGTYLDAVSMPDCTWNCISRAGYALKVSPSVLASVAAILASVLTYAATRGQNRQVDQSSHSRSVELSPFDVMTYDLFGTPDLSVEYGAVYGNITHRDILAGTLHGMVGNHHVELRHSEHNVTALITEKEHNLSIEKRSGTLYQAQIIYKNAQVHGAYNTRSFSKSERNEAGNRITNDYKSSLDTYGAMCDCMHSGQGTETHHWVGSIAVEGKNKGGDFENISCNCST